MRYAHIKYNDISNTPGIAVAVFLQGCPHHCPGCFNQETWDFQGGKELTSQIIDDIFTNKINENGIKRNLAILGGEPLAPPNLPATQLLISKAKEQDIPVYVWTGYVYENLTAEQKKVIEQVDVLIDGPFIEELKDFNLKMRGSSNQRIFRRVTT